MSSVNLSNLSSRERETVYWLLGMLEQKFGIEDLENGQSEDLPFEIVYAAKETVKSYFDEIESSTELLATFNYVFMCEWDINVPEYIELKRNGEWQ